MERGERGRRGERRERRGEKGRGRGNAIKNDRKVEKVIQWQENGKEKQG